MKDIYEGKAKQYAARHGVPWELASAVINQESRWDVQAKSPAGAMGLMQLMPKTAKGRGVTNPFDPDQNLNAGMAELGSHLKATKGDVATALAYYNWGQGNVKKFGMGKAPKETRDYIRIITGATRASTEMPQGNGMIKDAYGISVHPKAAEIVADSYAPRELDLSQPGIDEKQAILTQQSDEIANERAREIAEIGEATLTDAWHNAWENNITSKLIDGFTMPSVPGFKTTDAHKAQVKAAGMYADPDRANAVLAESTSEEMFQDRLANWKESQEFSQKLNNTVGEWKRTGIQAAGIGFSIADPALIATGVGIGFMGARLGMGVLKLAAADAASGSALSYVAAESVQQEYTVENAIADTILVGAFTGAGVAFSKGLDAARAQNAAQRAADRLADEPTSVPSPVSVERVVAAPARVEQDTQLPARTAADDTMSSEEGAEIVRAEESQPDPLANLPASELSPLDALSRMVTRRAAFAERPSIADKLSAKVETDPRERGLPLLSEDPMYAKLVSNGVVGEVDSLEDAVRLSPLLKKQGVPADAKAMYLPELDKVVIVRGAVEPGTDIRGLVLHEVGVHYGLERSVGSTRFQQIAEAVRNSASPEAQAARNAVPDDTPKWLKDEEAIGYLVENHPDIGWVRTMISTIKNALRDTFPVFGRMGITTNDVITYVKAAAKKAANARYSTKDIDDGLVWHASPVAGLDGLDTAYAKVGPNNSFFGWGNYVSSDRAVSEEYLLERIAQARAQGMDVSEGAMYRLRIKADKEAMITWEREVSSSKAGQLLEGTPLAALKGETGREYLGRIEAMYQGDQIAAANALWDAGVPGIRHATGYSRNMKNRYDSNYVLFHNDALDMAIRYSRTGEVAATTPTQLRLSIASQRMAADLMNSPEPVTMGTEEVSAAVRKYMSGFGDATGIKGVVNDMRTAFMAMGTRGALSESKAVRVIMNKLVEDPTGAAKSSGETAASYAGKLKAEAQAMTKDFDNLMGDVFTPEEKAEVMTALGGSAETRDRVNAAVFYEMAARRDAANAGVPYTPKDAAAAKVADLIDNVQTFVLDEAAASGNTHANKIKSSGVTGWTPYKWSTAKLFDLRNSNPAKYNEVIGLLKQQYVRDTLRPALDKLLAKGPQQKGMDTLFAELEARADYLVANKIDGITAGGSGFDLNRVSFTAEELLADVQSRGLSDAQAREAFQKELADVLADRSRHEMRLTEEFGEGTTLMDVMDFDAEGSMHSTINKFSGLAGVSRIAGIKDEEDMAALMAVLRKSDGVTQEDLDVVRLSLHQLGFPDPSVNSASPHLTAGLQIASAAMLGKRVFATMAEFASITIHSGGLIKSTKAMIDGIKKDDALINQFRELDRELVGEGWMVDSKNADLDPSGRADALNTVGRIGKRAGRLNSVVSMHRSVYGAMRRGVTRMAAAEVISKIAKGVPDTRLAALGITEADAAAIRAAWPGHTGYKQGEALPFARRGKALEPHMLPYELSEKLQTAITRQVDKAMPQSRWVGEQAKFAAEGGDLSAVFMQFLHNSFTAHNKVVIQGIAHDKWSALGYMTTVGIPAGLALYHLRVAANTLGMSDEEKAKYEERALEPQAMVMGVLNSVSAFGMVGTGLSWMDTLVGGMADGSTPAAALGYATRVSKAAGTAANAPFDENVSALDALGATLKVLPTGTTIPATLLYNQMLKND